MTPARRRFISDLGLGHAGGADLPVGGCKQSGWGRENGRDGIEAYTEVKSIAVALRRPGDWLAIKG
jgi:acyl-CoA reductase-like NAD-dependent aldehyde dehydrogenase